MTAWFVPIVRIIWALAYINNVFANPQLTVETHDGIVKGFFGKMEDSRKFLGIPYAKPPTGNLRWQSPVASEGWDGILEANKPPKPCPQNLHGNHNDEDCLFLNIFTPTLRRLDKKVPVLVWFHGGAFLYGDSYAKGHHDGEEFVADHNVIVVTVNYRLGALGWLVAENLMGNFGLKDQILALQWVKKNIEFFGGDKDNVTIYGHDAGAFCVLAHLVTGQNDNLFHKAMMFGLPLAVPLKTVGQAQNMGQAFLKNVECNDVACAMKLPAAKIVKGQPSAAANSTLVADVLTFGPVIDGKYIRDFPLKMINEGSFSKVPVIIGVNNAETSLFKGSNNPLKQIIPQKEDYFKKRRYVDLIKERFGKNAFEVLDVYRPSDDVGTNYQNFLKLTTAYSYSCNNWRLAHLLTKNGVTVYFHELSHVPDYLPIGTCPEGKTCHGSEVSYLFKSFPDLKSKASDLEDAELKTRNYRQIINEMYPKFSAAILSCFPQADDNSVNIAQFQVIRGMMNEAICPAGIESTPLCDVDKLCLHAKASVSAGMEFSKKELGIIDFYFRKMAGFANGDINMFDFRRGAHVQPWKPVNEKENFMNVAYMPSGGQYFHYEECAFWDLLEYNF